MQFDDFCKMSRIENNFFSLDALLHRCYMLPALQDTLKHEMDSTAQNLRQQMQQLTDAVRKVQQQGDARSPAAAAAADRMVVVKRNDIHSMQALGDGSVSNVFSAVLREEGGHGSMAVAIKTPRTIRMSPSMSQSSSSSGPVDVPSTTQNDILRELDMHTRIPPHQSIVRPIGSVVMHPGVSEVSVSSFDHLHNHNIAF